MRVYAELEKQYSAYCGVIEKLLKFRGECHGEDRVRPYLFEAFFSGLWLIIACICDIVVRAIYIHASKNGIVRRC